MTCFALVHGTSTVYLDCEKVGLGRAHHVLRETFY